MGKGQDMPCLVGLSLVPRSLQNLQERTFLCSVLLRLWRLIYICKMWVFTVIWSPKPYYFTELNLNTLGFSSSFQQQQKRTYKLGKLSSFKSKVKLATGCGGYSRKLSQFSGITREARGVWTSSRPHFRQLQCMPELKMGSPILTRPGASRLAGMHCIQCR